MKLCAIVLIVALAAAPAFAGYSDVAIYSDPMGQSCNLYEEVGVVNSVYVVHGFAPEANTSQFRIVDNWGAPVTGVDYLSNLHLGNIFTGVTVTYTECKQLPYVIARIDFMPMEPTPACSGTLEVVGDPASESGEVEMVDCQFNIRVANGGELVINEDETCPCWGGDPIRAETSTWSKVKALYR